MTLLDIDPMKRIEVIIWHVEEGFQKARKAAAEKDSGEVYRNLEYALGLIDPLIQSLTIFEESQKKSLASKLMKSQN